MGDFASRQEADIDNCPALVLQQLTKQFGEKIAVNQVSLEIPRGVLYGFVGPNGAGKTTVLSMVSGILRPTAGSAWVLGKNVWLDPAVAKAFIGVLPERDQMFDKLTGFELLRYTGLLRRLPEPEVLKRAEELLTALDLREAKNKLISDYSTGMAKKIGLASALIHAPKLLLLDEPFEAVDPVSAARIRDILRAYIADGGTVVFSSHVMELVENLCDHVAVISQGQIVAAGTLDQVRGDTTLQERFLGLVGTSQLQEGSLSWLHSL